MAWLLSGRAGLLAALDMEAFAEAGGLDGWPFAWTLPLALGAWFLASLMLAWLALRVGAWLDRKGRVVEAFAWPLRSRIFVVSSLSWMLVTGAFLLVTRPDLSEWPGWGLLAAGALAGLLLPFMAWRPELLDALRPTPILGLHWPGWRAVLFVSVCVLAGMVFAVVEGWLEPLLPGLVLLVLDEILYAGGLMLTLLAWFNRGRFAPMAADLRRLPVGGVVSELLALAWLVGTLTVLLGMPLLVATVHAIYVVPELERVDDSLSWASTAAVWLIRQGQGVSLIAALPVAWYLALVEGRWGRGRGIGCSPIAGTAD
ncbi:MAG: hypothetical protein GXC75_03300 [Xanthomonadaceae bacterium]|nr:hypothetical protein [Xanthomonadaceae bacterium]